jgi:hypothetical protein
MRSSMTGAVILIVASIVIACGAVLLVFARWVSRSWTVLEDGERDQRGGESGVWAWLLGHLGRGPRRLTYRRDDRGRFRKHRR